MTTDARPLRTRRRRVSWTGMRGQWPLALLLGGLLLALVFVIAERWRRAAFVFGIVAVVGAVMRLALPESRAGLVAVRSRGFDVGFYGLTGAVALWLAWSIDSLGTG